MSDATPTYEMDPGPPDTSEVLGRQRMPEVIDCHECPATFTSGSRWTEYAEHLRREHPQSVPTPAQREAPEAVQPTAPPRDGQASFVECPDGKPFSRGQLGNHRRFKHPAVETVNGGEQPGNRDARGSVPSPGTVQSVAEGPVRGGPSTTVPPVDRPDASDSSPRNAEDETGSDREFVAQMHRWESAVAALDEALNRFGWHLDTCPAYWHGSNILDQPASDLDNTRFDCTCGFRAALALAVTP